MNATNPYFLFTTIAILLLSIASFDSNSSNHKIELKQALKLFNQAFKHADVQTLDSLLSSRYVHTNSGSRPIGKADWLGWLKTRRKAIEAGDFRYESYAVEELEIHHYSESAVVTGRNIATGVSRGKPFKIDIRFTHLWIKSNNRWVRAAFQDAKVKE